MPHDFLYDDTDRLVLVACLARDCGWSYPTTRVGRARAAVRLHDETGCPAPLHRCITCGAYRALGAQNVVLRPRGLHLERTAFTCGPCLDARSPA